MSREYLNPFKPNTVQVQNTQSVNTKAQSQTNASIMSNNETQAQGENLSTENLSSDDFELIKKELERKVSELKTNLENSKNTRGVFTSISNGVQSLFGGGDKKISNQISDYETLIGDLENDPSKILDTYQTIMGAKLDYSGLYNLKQSQNVSDNLSDDEKQAVIAQLESQYGELETNFSTTKNSNGWISGAWDGFKNITGLGAGSNKTQAEMDTLKNQLEDLKNGKTDLATAYKNITGQNLTSDNLEKLLNNEDGSKISDTSKAAKSLDDYQEGQKMAVDTVADITSGVVSVGAVAFGSTVGICAAPFTAGASLGLVASGLGLAAGVGAVVKTAIKASDSVGNEKNYTAQNLGYDLVTGAANGAMGVFSNGLAGSVGKGIMKAAGLEALETTVGQAVSATGKSVIGQGAKETLVKTGAAAAEMAIDGGLSGAMDSLSRDIGTNLTNGDEEDKNILEILQDTATGTIGGAVGGVVIGGAMKGASKIGTALGESYNGAQIEKQVNKLMQEGIDSSTARKALKLDEETYQKFLNLKQEGLDGVYAISACQFDNSTKFLSKSIPERKIADASALTSEAKEKFEQLLSKGKNEESFITIGENKVSKYYLTDLAALNDEKYAKALDLIENKGFSAPTALEAVSKRSEEFDEYVQKVLDKPSKMKKEITPEVSEKLLDLAKKLEDGEYVQYAGQSSKDINNLFGDLVEDKSKLTSRAKGTDSALSKLETKYENSKLDLDLDIKDELPNTSNYINAKTALADAYGSRLQMKGLSSEITENLVMKNGFSSMEEFSSALQKEMKEGKLNPKTQAALDSLKEKQNNETFQRLKNAITTGEFEITEINNYGNELSSYFTQAQIQDLALTYGTVHRNDGKLLKVTTLYDKESAVNISSELDNFDISKYEGLEEGRYKEIMKALQDDYKNNSSKAVKDSGYTSCQMNFVQTFKDGTKGLGEFQIRGEAVNAFGDVEHIPYDIRKGKITLKDTKYQEVFSTIKNMSQESYDSYNSYLTEMYNYLRMQELGISGLVEPSIPTNLTLESGEQLSKEMLKNISYSGLVKFH